MKQGKCLICGNSQHMIGNCPKNRNTNPGTPNQQQLNQGKRPPAKARAYALTGIDNPEATDIVEGKAIVHNFVCKVLFDPGATHSFISTACASKIKLRSETLDTPYEVYSPMGTCSTTYVRYRNCPVTIENKEYLADLIDLPIQEYDLILGMDWLYRHQAIVDCFTKTIRLGNKVETMNEENLSCIKSAIIFSTRAKKVLRKGGQGFWAYLINKPQDKLKLEDVKVVNEFPEVFPKELRSLPPDRKIEFVIEPYPQKQSLFQKLHTE